jgi:hypothetical protein
MFHQIIGNIRQSALCRVLEDSNFDINVFDIFLTNVGVFPNDLHTKGNAQRYIDMYNRVVVSPTFK